MKNRAKSPTKTPKVDRSDLKRSAMQHFRNGGTPTDFAAEHGLPRTTVIGWKRKWEDDREETVMGRPRKMQRYNEFRVLELMVSTEIFQDWQSVRECIKRQSGDQLSRRSVFRLMKRWKISSHEKQPGAGMLVLVGHWVHPPDTIDPTVDRSGREKSQTIWRLIFRGCLEGFMFTSDASRSSLDIVASAVAKRLAGRNPKLLRTNHAGLAKRLREMLPDLKIEDVPDT